MHITPLRARRALAVAGALVAGAAATTLFAAPAAAQADEPPITITTIGPFCNPNSGTVTIRFDISTTSTDELKVVATPSSNGINIAGFDPLISAGDDATLFFDIPVINGHQQENQPNPPTASLTVSVSKTADNSDLGSTTTDPVSYSCGEAALTDVDGSVACDDHGNAVIDWVVANQRPVPGALPLTARVVDFEPRGEHQSTMDKDSETVTEAEPAHFIQTIKPGHGTASIVIGLKLRDVDSDQETIKGDTNEGYDPENAITVDYDCVEPTAGPTTEPPTTDPTTTPAPLPINLPVTGTSIVAFVGTALVLLAVGAGMIFLARRRRVSGQS